MLLRSLRLLLCLLSTTHVLSTYVPCLSNNYTATRINGRALTIGAGNWDAPIILGKIAQIILNEVIGIETGLSNAFGGSADATRGLLGCEDQACTTRKEYPDVQMDFEHWYTEAGAAIRQVHGSDLAQGYIGYDGQEGLYMKETIANRIWNDTRLPIEYFITLSHPDRPWMPYFTRVSNITIPPTSGCRGDVATQMTAQGMTCDPDGWWYSPACSNDKDSCIPVLMGGVGWFGIETCKILESNMIPMAVTFLSWPDQRIVDETVDALFFWWRPDWSYMGLGNVRRVFFPKHDRQAWAQGIYTTDFPDFQLEKLMWTGVEAMSYKAARMFDNFHMTWSGINEFMAQMYARSGTDPDLRTTLACEWVRANEAIWRLWIPDERQCMFGDGMVDAANNFTSNWADAVSCVLCPTGRISTQVSSTIPSQASRSCELCPLGTYSNALRAAACSACPLGSFAEASGQSACVTCTIGSYQNNTGATACQSCGTGRASPAAWTTMYRMATGSGTVISYVSASGSASSCTCDAGYRFQGEECVPCSSELECVGMGNVEVLSGFAALNGDVSRIFECSLDRRWCPGGAPGVCAEGREGVQCGQCKATYTPGKNGTCEKCAGSDVAPFTIVVIIVFCMLCIAYHAVAKVKQGTGKAPLSVVLVVTTGSQVIVFTQMTGVLSSIAVEWDEPFATLLAVAKILTSFNLDILRLSCVATLSPLGTYVSRISVIAIGIAAILLIFVVHTTIFFGRDFRTMGKKLIVALGTLSMGLFISVVSAITAPMQCVKHPSGDWTVRTFPTVLCDADSDSDFAGMIGIAAVVSMLPLGLLALVTFIVRSFPKRMQMVDTGFFEITGFLFVCYRVETYWFCLVIWSRNLLVSLVPILSDLVAQITIFNVLLLTMICLVSHFTPWRAKVANGLDLVIYFAVIGANSLALGFASPNTTVLAALCVALILVALLGLIGAGCYGLLKITLPQRKQYEYFLSHHKAACGAFARLLKMMILENRSGINVFIDADNLTNLDLLFDAVGSDVENFILIASAEFFRRPWCVGEVTIARIKKVNTYVLYCNDFKVPDADFIDNYAKYVPDLTVLTENNITVEQVQAAILWFKQLHYVSLPGKLDAKILDKLVANMIVGKVESLDGPQDFVSTSSVHTKATRKEAEIMVAANEDDFEAMATARILCNLLLRHGRGEAVSQNSVAKLPEVLADTADDKGKIHLTERTSMVVLVLTNGCLQSPTFITTLYEAATIKAALMPVVGGDSFQFPSPDLYYKLYRIVRRSLEVKTTEAAEMVVSGIFSMFKRIAPLFESNSSQLLLDAQSYEVHKRIAGHYLSAGRTDADWMSWQRVDGSASDTLSSDEYMDSQPAKVEIEPEPKVREELYDPPKEVYLQTWQPRQVTLCL